MQRISSIQKKTFKNCMLRLNCHWKLTDNISNEIRSKISVNEKLKLVQNRQTIPYIQYES